MKTDFNKITVDELKKQFPFEYDPLNERFNIINSLIYEKLLIIQQQRQNKNRLLIVDELPELFILFDMRKTIKPFKRKMRLKIKTLRILYKQRNNKSFNDRLNKRLEKEIRKRTKTKESLLIGDKK